MKYVSYLENRILFYKHEIADAYYLLINGKIELFDYERTRK